MSRQALITNVQYTAHEMILFLQYMCSTYAMKLKHELTHFFVRQYLFNIKGSHVSSGS